MKMYCCANRARSFFRTSRVPVPGSHSLKQQNGCVTGPGSLLKYPSPSHSEFSGSAVRVEYVKQISRTRSLYKHHTASVKPVWSSTCFLAEHVFRSLACGVCVCEAFVCVCLWNKKVCEEVNHPSKVSAVKTSWVHTETQLSAWDEW